MNTTWPYLVHYSGAAPAQVAQVDARPQTMRLPTLDAALFFACRTLARGGTVIRVEGPDGLVVTASEVEAHCRERG